MQTSDTYYIGITIGPIYDTISLSSSPAALWAASYLFSYISKRLCELIADEDEPLVENEKDILSPFFSKDNQLQIDQKGIGLYHDRIVFRPMSDLSDDAVCQNVFDRIDAIFEIVTWEIARAFSDNEEDSAIRDNFQWFRQYLQLHTICYKSNDTPIMDSSQYLDAIELEKTYPTLETKNPLAELFNNPDSDKNIRIRNQIRDRLSSKQWPFPVKIVDGKREQLAEIKFIVGRQSETERIKKLIQKETRRKINSYYAIVQADGDKFGDYIKACEKKGIQRVISHKCLQYCSEAATIIQQYGGVPLYAGGDDLLFLAPLISTMQEEINLLDLLKSLQVIFYKKFAEENTPDVFVSFGVAICYYRYPLYEAFAEATHMLFDCAKINRNAIGISLIKHSGQTIKFVLEDIKTNNLFTDLNGILKKHIESDVLKSIRGKIWESKAVFREALTVLQKGNKSVLYNAFKNTFDSEIHKENADIKEIYQLLNNIATLNNSASVPLIRKVGDDIQSEDENEDILIALDILMRFARFWGEKGEEGDAEVID